MHYMEVKTSHNVLRLIALASALLFSRAAIANIPGLAPKQPWSFDGYVSYLGSLSDSPMTGTVDDHQIQNRLNFEYRFDNGFRFNTSMRNRALFGDSLDNPFYRDNVTRDMGYFNLSHDWYNDDDAIVTTQFDRLYLTYQNDKFRGRVGRYRVNWGMNTIWNPNDLFNPFSIYNVDYPEKPGVDAVEATYKLGFASELNAVYAPNDNSDLDSYAARYLFNRSGWDAQLIVGKSYLDWTIGGGIAGDIKGFGIKAEASYFHPDDEKQADSLGIELDSTLVASVEGVYSFGGTRNWASNVALLYISDPIDLDVAALVPLTARTLSFTQWTSYADLGFDISALTRMTVQGSYYDDGTYFVGSSLTYSLADDWTLSGFAQYFSGVIDNTSVYAQLAWYF